MLHRIITIASLASLTVALASCGPPPPSSHASRRARPTSHEAATRAHAEQEASGDKDLEAGDKHWGGWRYDGSRDDCFFVVHRTCFGDQDAACKAAKCGRKTCQVDGGGPATISCR